MDVKTNDVPASCHILTNSPALHSLKRQQLVQLCKRNGIKATGKNADIVEKLKAHAHNMNIDPSTLSGQPFSSDDEDKENRRIAMPRPSEQWTIIEEDSREVERVQLGLKEIREEVQQEMGTISSLKSFGASQSSGEFGGATTSSKGSSMTSSLKAFATSLKRTNSKSSLAPPSIAMLSTGLTHSTKLSTVPSSSTKLSTSTENPPINDLLAATSTPYHEQPHKYPVLPDPEPLNADDSRDQSMLELGASTIRLVTPVPNAESPPSLQPFIPTFEPSYSPVSPSFPSIYPSFPVDSDSDPNPPGAFPNMVSTPSAPPKTSASLAPPRSPAPPFLFGSPAHRISNTEFNSAAASVLAEMNVRLGLAGTSNEVGLGILQSRRVEAQPAAPPPFQERPRTDVTNKFDRAHEREFERMEGLGTWFAKRAGASPSKPDGETSKKRKSDVLGGPARRPIGASNARGRRVSRVVTPGLRRPLVAPATVEVDAKRVKRVRISTVNRGDAQDAAAKPNEDGNTMDVDEKVNEEKERERAAIKRKLEVSRARRRSSMGRVSVGAGQPALIPNKPKKGIATKFGFLSSAKTLVKNVWKGAGASAPEPPKPIGSNPPVVPRNPPNVLTKVHPALRPNAAKNAPVKPAVKGPVAKVGANTSLRVPPTGLGLGRKVSTHLRTDSSMGTKSSTASSTRASTSNVSCVNAAFPAARRGPIPSFQPSAGRTSRTNSLASGGTAGSRTSSIATTNSRGGSITKPGSMGTRKPGLSADGSTSNAVRKRTSTLFAPTASSLAKMQSTVKPPSLSRAANSSITGTGADLRGLAKAPAERISSLSGVSGFNFTCPSPTAGASAPNKETNSIFTGVPLTVAPAQNLASDHAPSKPRALPPRRPRISRSRVIAKVGAQRAASGSSLTSNASVRRSLNISKPRGSLSSRASGVSRGREVAAVMSARKRLRQSEILRRRSKVGGMSPVLDHTVKENAPEGEDSDTDNGDYEERTMSPEVSMED